METVCLLGASGTMGFAAFKFLWERREKYKVVVLLRPSQKNIKLMRRYLRAAGLPPNANERVTENQHFKIVWGDATLFADAQTAMQGVDWVLNAMAYISPKADYYPEKAQAVNVDAIGNILKAISLEPDGNQHIRYIHTGTVAETGDRLPPIHWGRVGDPLKPSVFDYYAITKIAGERMVMESEITHWASLRLTYIVPTDYREMMSLMDPIMFHQPLHSCMENISDRCAGLGLVHCLDIPDDSSFWRKAYNMGGGPEMRCTAGELMEKSMQLLGLSGIDACMEREWFARQNFHMQYYLDSDVLNGYLHYWEDSMEDCWSAMLHSMPFGLRMLRFLCKTMPSVRRQVEQQTKARLRKMAAENRNGTLYWQLHGNQARMTAFFGAKDTDNEPGHAQTLVPVHISQGYDEDKGANNLADLQGAAVFRGGVCCSDEWSGDLFSPVDWECARGHRFTMKPNTVLKGGHWCPACAAPPWRFQEEARINPFFAQVWYPLHDPEEKAISYPLDLIQDIAGADRS